MCPPPPPPLKIWYWYKHCAVGLAWNVGSTPPLPPPPPPQVRAHGTPLILDSIFSNTVLSHTPDTSHYTTIRRVRWRNKRALPAVYFVNAHASGVCAKLQYYPIFLFWYSMFIIMFLLKTYMYKYMHWLGYLYPQVLHELLMNPYVYETKCKENENMQVFGSVRFEVKSPQGVPL